MDARASVGPGSAPRITITPERKYIDAVFEGGGVRGIGLVGAISAVESAGYSFKNVAGTSAGAIVATLLAAGYGAGELKEVIGSIDFNKITDTNFVGRIPVVGPIANVLARCGIYEGDYFLRLMRKLLADKGKKTFADFVMPEYADNDQYRYKVRVVASDVTRGALLVLPQDLKLYGLDPDAFEVALAVRMSMSIPFFFKPVRLRSSKAQGRRTSIVVDGGLLSDFPVELFDSPGTPEWPTFGFRLVETGGPQTVKYDITGPISMIAALFGTAMNAHDARYVETHNFVRSILIDTLGVSSTNFGLTQPEKDELYSSGVSAATDFLTHWDFEQYKAMFRSGAPAPSRRDLVAAAAMTPRAPKAAVAGEGRGHEG